MAHLAAILDIKCYALGRGFQLAQLVKSLIPKTDWCLGLMIKIIIRSGYHKLVVLLFYYFLLAS